MKLTYLASAYSHPDPAVREQRFQAACRAAAALMQLGYCVLSPIAHSHCIAAHGLPTGWDFWQRLDSELLLRCDEMVVLTLDGWRESRGVAAEIELARAVGLPVRYVGPEIAESSVDAACRVTLAHVAKEAGV
jgi:hypothetical protein